MINKGKIEEVKGEDIAVRIHSPEECSGCKSCGNAKSGVITLKNIDSTREYAVGDEVLVEFRQKNMMGLYMYLYFVPLVIFVVVNITLYLALNNPIIGFFASLVLIAWYYLGPLKKMLAKKEFLAKIVQ